MGYSGMVGDHFNFIFAHLSFPFQLRLHLHLGSYGLLESWGWTREFGRSGCCEQFFVFCVQR